MIGDYMDDCLTLAQHNEFAQRIDEENKRQNERLTALENTVREINKLVVSVERMAVSMQQMGEEQKRTNDRLDKIEAEPANKWRAATSSIITGIIGLALGALGAIIGSGIMP